MIPELLSPAGSPDALLAAASAGADAVYFGANAFSNRMRARNFDDGEMNEALAQCRVWGVRTYVTVNTRVEAGEMDAVLSLVDRLCAGGVSAFIVADCGVAREIHRRYPTVPLHASTQMTLMTRADMDALAPYGFTRIVLPREISLREAALLSRTGPLETELFCHGAHCVSVSGQCLMSYVMGGRSGNRGECAQPCRMAYSCTRIGADTDENRQKLAGILAKAEKPAPPREKRRDPYLERYPEAIESGQKRGRDVPLRDKTLSGKPVSSPVHSRLAPDRAGFRKMPLRPQSADYPLSLRDMCLAAWIPELCDSGVASLKIEGRQKSAPYVYGVTRIYRTLLDEKRRATPDEIAELDRLFSREGFTDAYFANAPEKKTPYVSMCGVRPPMTEKPDPGAQYDVSGRRLPITGQLTAARDAPMRLTLTCGGITVAVTGETVQRATGNPISADAVRRNLLKTGGTAFVFADGEPRISLSPDAWIPVSAVNAIRRAAIDTLLDAVRPKPVYPQATGDEVSHLPQFDRTERYAVVTKPTQITPRALRYFDRIFLPAQAYLASPARDGKIGADLPPVCFSDERLRDTVAALAESGCRAVRVHAPGQLHIAKRYGMQTVGSLRLNVWNPAAARFWFDLGLDRLTASPEATLAMLRGFDGALGAVVYGRLPLMRTERCFLAGSGDKPSCGGSGGRTLPGADCLCPENGCLGILTDRMRMRFPVIAERGECEIENATPIWMADRTMPALSHTTCLFTIEPPNEVDNVIHAYETGEKREGRRIR